MKFSSRVRGISLADLIFVEVFSGTAGLTAEVRRLGCQHSTAVDAHVTKQVKAPVLRIDLSTMAGQTLLWRILKEPRVFAIHLGPPCGTSSRAREIKRKFGFSPRPLRSVQHPDGLPNLAPRDHARVETANSLYQLSGAVMAYATENGILCTLENPARSHMWSTTFLNDQLKCVHDQLFKVFFHHCAFGSKRKKHTQLLVNHVCFNYLGRVCDGSHEHLPWGVTPQGWATSLEVEYPLELCKAWALCLRAAALQHGALELPTSMQHDVEASLHLRAKATLGNQPRGKKLKPLMKEHAYIITVSGPHDLVHALPQKLDQAHVLPPLCAASPPVKVLPPHSKRLRAPVLQGDTAGLPAEDQRWMVEFGVSWDPESFVKCASGLSHPAHFLDGVHEALSTLLDKFVRQSAHSIALERTEAMRKWTQRLHELRNLGLDGLSESQNMPSASFSARTSVCLRSWCMPRVLQMLVLQRT